MILVSIGLHWIFKAFVALQCIRVVLEKFIRFSFKHYIDGNT